MRCCLRIAAFIVFTVCSGVTPVFNSVAADAMRGPLPVSSVVSTKPERDGESMDRLAGRFWLTAYQHVFGRFIRSHCPMQPSCSTYSYEAVSRHGLALGVMLTADRLLREGDDIRSQPQIWFENRGWRCPDPVERHTFWWAGEGRRP